MMIAQTRVIVGRYGEKWWDSEYILNSELKGFTERLDVEYESEREELRMPRFFFFFFLTTSRIKLAFTKMEKLEEWFIWGREAGIEK